MTMNGSHPAGMPLPLDLRRKGSGEDHELSRPESPGDTTSSHFPREKQQASRTAATSKNRGFDHESAPAFGSNAVEHRTQTQKAASTGEPHLGEASSAKKPVSSLPLRKRPFPTDPETRHLRQSCASPAEKKHCSPEQNKYSPERRLKKHFAERTEVPRRHDRTPAEASQRLPDVPAYIGCGHALNSFHGPPVFVPLLPFAVPLHHIERDHLSQEVALATRQDDDGDTALHIAVVQGLEEVVRRLIYVLTQTGRDLDIYNNLMQTPLHLAVITHQANLVQALLNAGADPGTLDRNGQTAAHLCCEHGLRSCLALILKYSECQSCLKVRNYEGLTPLHLAVQKGDKELVRLLLDSGADIDAVDFKSGRSPLIHAVENNNMEMISMLIESGVNVNAQSYSGNTALHSACGRGQVEAVRVLLRNGADSSLKNYHNDTPLMVAKNKKVTDVLRGKGSRSQNPKLVEPTSDSLSPQRCTPQSRQHSIDGTPIQSPSHSVCPSPLATHAHTTQPLRQSPSHSPKAPLTHSPTCQPLEHLPRSESATATQENKQQEQQLQMKHMQPTMLVDCGMGQRMPIQFLPFMCTDLQPSVANGHGYPPYHMQTLYSDPPCIILTQSLPQAVNHSRHSRPCYVPGHSRPSSRSSDQSESGSTVSVSSMGKDES
ncbi:B-cell lymphoma 3 protein homolog [Scleropages formosus]|uniref:BCL3 transcription coactivator n=1 Tax=Scleropages formosus TaxID=113540 RepID=A0A8C9SAS6_SCLFO|nr:B-cell lymphoma 3 protein [Scleropages formosus]